MQLNKKQITFNYKLIEKQIQPEELFFRGLSPANINLIANKYYWSNTAILIPAQFNQNFASNFGDAADFAVNYNTNLVAGFQINPDLLVSKENTYFSLTRETPIRIIFIAEINPVRNNHITRRYGENFSYFFYIHQKVQRYLTPAELPKLSMHK